MPIPRRTRTHDNLLQAAVLSDGASRLVDHYALTTWPGLLDILAAEGPAELIRRVRVADNADSTGNRYKRSDDATAIYVSMDGPAGI